MHETPSGAGTPAPPPSRASQLAALPLVLWLLTLAHAFAGRRGVGGELVPALAYASFTARYVLQTTLVALALLSLGLELERRTRLRARMARLGVLCVWPVLLGGYVLLVTQRADALMLAGVAGGTLGLVLSAAALVLRADARWARHLRRAAIGALVIAGALCLALSVGQLGFRYRAIGMFATTYAAAFLGAGLALSRLPRLVGAISLSGFALLVALSFSPFAEIGRPVAAALTSAGRLVTATGYSHLSERSASRPQPADDALEPFAPFSALPSLGERDLSTLNLLLITTEATRFDQTSLGGADTTPNLQRLAQSGIAFQRAYSPSNGTLASMASLHSLTLPSSAELTTWRVSWHGELRPEAATLAELFASAGFDTFRVSHNFHGSFERGLLGFEQGFARSTLIGDDGRGEGRKLDEQIATATIRELAAAKAGRPFFGWTFFGGPHAPYDVHDPSAPSATPLDRYRQELRAMDKHLGRVLDTLRETGLAEKTIVVFAADHGEEFGEHGGAGHLTLYEECVRIPLVVAIPGVAPHVVTKPTSALTALLWALSRHHPALRSAVTARLEREVIPLARAAGGAVIVESVGHDVNVTALIAENSKAICDVPSGWCDVFDLRSDPSERRPLDASSPLRASWQARFERYLSVRANVGRYVTEP